MAFEKANYRAAVVSLTITMNGYSQPEGYRFSHDSIELAQRAAEFVTSRALKREGATPKFRVLDLCAGCGVVGLELAKILKANEVDVSGIEVDFNEVQSAYEDHFRRNSDWAASWLKTRWLQMNYADLGGEKYDLIVSNPPYFDRAHGNLPPCALKARARFFLDSDFETLLESVSSVLAPGGTALILVRDLKDHGIRRESSFTRVFGSNDWEWLKPIRGTGLVRFTQPVRGEDGL